MSKFFNLLPLLVYYPLYSYFDLLLNNSSSQSKNGLWTTYYVYWLILQISLILCEVSAILHIRIPFHTL